VREHPVTTVPTDVHPGRAMRRAASATNHRPHGDGTYGVPVPGKPHPRQRPFRSGRCSISKDLEDIRRQLRELRERGVDS